jgi:chromosome segregation ATPase
MNWQHTKQFWITEIKKQQGIHHFKDSDFSALNWWKDHINNATTYQELDELARKFRKEVVSKSYLGFENLLASEERELNKCVVKDVSELEKELNILKTTERKAFEAGIETYKEDIKAFENKLKSIVGNDLTNWETKIVKAGSSDKDIVDLQKKISELATEKDNLQAEIKKKQDQILNHKCDNPNNAELNQIKEELKKMTQEKDKLQNELNKKDFSPSLPTPPSNNEEDKREELENSKLTVEQLREKLKSKQEEIKNLRIQLNQQKSKTNQNEKLIKNSYSLSTLFLVGVVCLLFGSLVMYVIKKKKKQTS